MADDYYLQLQQVQAALLFDASNSELLKLKNDLQEIISLNKNLKCGTEHKNSKLFELRNQESKTEKIILNFTNSLKNYDTTEQLKRKEWKIGDRCLAKWCENDQYYEAIINKILSNDQINVTFLPYQNRSVISISDIKEIKENKASRKRYQNSCEYTKKKKLKKQQRLQELEQECENEKNKWLTFNTKVMKKKFVTKSIFQSPDNNRGRIGVGTCGVSGKPMTVCVVPKRKRI